MYWLITGFGPFEDVEDNVTEQVAPLLGAEFHILQVSYEAVDEFLENLDADTFDALLALGHDKRATRVRIETLGRNVIGPRPDVRGYLPASPPSETGPDTILASLWQQIELEETDNWTISDDACGYLCNYMLYQAARAFPTKLVGFLHLPPAEVVSPEQQAVLIRELIKTVVKALKTQAL